MKSSHFYAGNDIRKSVKPSAIISPKTGIEQKTYFGENREYCFVLFELRHINSTRTHPNGRLYIFVAQTETSKNFNLFSALFDRYK